MNRMLQVKPNRKHSKDTNYDNNENNTNNNTNNHNAIEKEKHPFAVSGTWRAAPQSFHSARLALPLHLPPIDYLTTSQRSTSLPVASGLARHMDADLRHRPFRALRDKGRGGGRVKGGRDIGSGREVGEGRAGKAVKERRGG